MKDYFAVLSIKPEATADEIKAQYRKLSKLYHPDINPSAGSKFAEINEAYEVLGSPEKKREYLESLRKEKQRAQQAQAQPRGRAGANAGAGAGAGAQADLFTAFFNSSGDQRMALLVNQVRQQSYKQGYDAASSALNGTITTLNNEITSLRSQLGIAEERSRQTLNQMSSNLSSQLKQEMERRTMVEGELMRLKAEHNAALEELKAVKQDLEIANETIDEMFSDPDFASGQSKATNNDDDDVDDVPVDEETTDDEAIAQFEEELAKAEAGDSSAQNLVGEYLLYGTGVEPDLEAALEWFKKSAESSNPDGLLNLGICYLRGEGTQMDKQFAEFYIRKSAYSGNKNAIQFCKEQGWSLEK